MMRAVLMIAVVLLCGGCTAVLRPFAMTTFDSTKAMRGIAEALRKISPAAEWHSPAPGPDLTEIHLLRPGVALMGFEIADPPRNTIGPYAAVDLETGKVLWQADVGGEDWRSMSATPAGDIVVVRRTNAKEIEYLGIDARSGARRWSVSRETAHILRVDGGHGLLLLADPRPDPRLVAHDLRTGVEKWSVKLASVASHILTSEDEILIIGAAISAYDPRSGKRQWKVPLGSPLAARSAPVVSPEALVVPLQHAVLIRNAAHKLWKVRYDGAPRTVLATAGLVLVEFSKGDGSTLIAIDPAKGTTRWGLALASSLTSAIGRRDGKLAFMTASQLVLVEADTGKVACTWQESAGGAALPSHVRVEDRQVLVATERWVGAFPLDCSPARWRHVVALTDTWDEASSRYQQAIIQSASAHGASSEEKAKLVARLKQTRALESSPKSMFLAQHETFMRDSARRLQRTTNRAERDQIHSARQASIAMALANMEATQAIEQSMAMADLQVSALAFTVGIGDRVKAIKKSQQLAAVRSEVVRSRDRKLVVRRTHFGALQGRWFVRPFHWEDGRGLLVVDTSNGAWREIVISPSEPALSVLFLNVPVGLIDPASSALVSAGVGLDTAQWQTWDDLAPDGVTFHRSLMAFDLNKVKWRKAARYARKSLDAVAKRSRTR